MKNLMDFKLNRIMIRLCVCTICSQSAHINSIYTDRWCSCNLNKSCQVMKLETWPSGQENHVSIRISILLHILYTTLEGDVLGNITQGKWYRTSHLEMSPIKMASPMLMF